MRGVLIKAEQETRGSSTIYLDESGTQPLSPGAVSFGADNNISSETHTYNFGVTGFVGASFNFSHYSIFVEGGGNYGFVPIQKSSENGKNYTGGRSDHHRLCLYLPGMILIPMVLGDMFCHIIL